MQRMQRIGSLRGRVLGVANTVAARRLLATKTPPSSSYSTAIGQGGLRKKKTAAEAVDNILYNTPLISQSSSRRILSCLVTNEPGVLSRISGILAGRGFNIDSLVVSETDVHDLRWSYLGIYATTTTTRHCCSRMTIVLNAPRSIVDQARRQLEDLVPVWAVLDYTDVSIIERELLLIKVSLLPQDRPQYQNQQTRSVSQQLPVFGPDFQRQALVELTRLFQGRVVDLTMDSVTMELCAKPSRINAFIQLCRPYGILEAARSGMMAIPRAPVRGHVDDEDEHEDTVEDEEASTVDATQLPPG